MLCIKIIERSSSHWMETSERGKVSREPVTFLEGPGTADNLHRSPPTRPPSRNHRCPPHAPALPQSPIAFPDLATSRSSVFPHAVDRLFSLTRRVRVAILPYRLSSETAAASSTFTFSFFFQRTVFSPPSSPAYRLTSSRTMPTQTLETQRSPPRQGRRSPPPCASRRLRSPDVAAGRPWSSRRR